MQPVQGMFASMQTAPQPARVAGPRQTKPWARRQTSGSATTSWGRRNALICGFCGFVAAREHSEHNATSGASTVPFAGSFPSTSAITAALMRCPGGGQPGRK